MSFARLSRCRSWIRSTTPRSATPVAAPLAIDCATVGAAGSLVVVHERSLDDIEEQFVLDVPDVAAVPVDVHDRSVGEFDVQCVVVTWARPDTAMSNKPANSEARRIIGIPWWRALDKRRSTPSVVIPFPVSALMCPNPLSVLPSRWPPSCGVPRVRA
jgi:hypothetical protein